MDRGAWQVMVHRVVKNWTRVKRLSMRTHTPYETGFVNLLNTFRPHAFTYTFFLL